MRLELVNDWMTRDLITITPETTLADADALMVEKMIRRLPVVDNGRLVGIVTYGDVRNARPSSVNRLNIWELSYLIPHITIREMMTRDPITVWPETTIGEAAQLMLKNMIGCLPVLDKQGQLVGIITESDIFRMVARDWKFLQEQAGEPYAHYG
ncbi:MAG: CBS domain-containing protein [Ardenticatenaceae bacterium]|nr:CBS domain-containing protein [Ardenticatenaceae bacterium]